jgi:hypothetical protein
MPGYIRRSHQSEVLWRALRRPRVRPNVEFAREWPNAGAPRPSQHHDLVVLLQDVAVRGAQGEDLWVLLARGICFEDSNGRGVDKTRVKLAEGGANELWEALEARLLSSLVVFSYNWHFEEFIGLNNTIHKSSETQVRRQ